MSVTKPIAVERAVRVKRCRIVPSEHLITATISDTAPGIIAAYAQSEKQVLLAKVRHNRLIDIFLGITAYSLQTHLRARVKGIGEVEIDEVYVGVNPSGEQFVIPVQAAGWSGQLSPTQTRHDIACCLRRFPGLRCRPIAAKLMRGDVIAMLRLTTQDGQIRIANEKHYKLVAPSEIGAEGR